MSDYKPTTEEVRDYYMHGQFSDPAISEQDHAKDFDRWFAAELRKAKIEALREAADDIEFRDNEWFKHGNIVHARNGEAEASWWLERRADEMEGEQG